MCHPVRADPWNVESGMNVSPAPNVSADESATPEELGREVSKPVPQRD